MKRTNKLWLTMLLTLLVAALVAVGLTAAAEETPTIIDSGYCGGEGDGTNLIWTLDNEGTLTISGEGAMKSYAFTSDNRIQFVIMENGVTDIGYSAFSTCASLREVSIPGSVTKIGLFAFEGCASLKSVYIPEGVTIIDDCAFQYCWSLNSVYIPVSVEQIGWESFDLSPLKDVFCAGIRSQHNILFGENNSSLLKAKWHYNVFAGGYCGGEGDGTNLVWVLDNDGTLTISGTGAMKSYLDEMPPWYDYADLIRCVILEDGVTTVGDAAFVGCANLIEATMPDSVERVGMGAFSGCQSLKSIDLSHVTKICHLAFAGCAALNSVNLTVCTDIEDTGFTECTALSQLFISEPMNLGPYAFYGCPLTDIFYTGSEAQWAQDIADKFNPYYPVTSVPFESIRIHYNVVDWGYCGGDLVWIYDSDDTLTISGQGGTGWYGEYSDGETNHDTGAPWYPYRERIQTVVLEEGVSQIGVNAFTSCTGLKNVIIPLSLESVLEVSFWMCGSIENVFYAGDEAQWNKITFWDIGGPGVTGNDDLLNARRHYNATWHTPGEPVRENEVAAACTTAGSYDEVIYCTQCDYEFSRTPVTVDPTGHQHTEQRDEVQPPRDGHGHEAGLFCTDCNDWITGDVIHNQNGPRENEIPATVDAPGSVEIQCTACGEWGLYELPQLEPDEPDEPGDFFRNLTEGFRRMARGIIEVFLRLIRWLGGKR